jgi:hypothetical protein
MVDPRWEMVDPKRETCCGVAPVVTFQHCDHNMSGVAPVVAQQHCDHNMSGVGYHTRVTSAAEYQGGQLQKLITATKCGRYIVMCQKACQTRAVIGKMSSHNGHVVAVI